MLSNPDFAMITVSIVSAVVSNDPPSWKLVYEVHNTMKQSIWLVVDESLVFRRSGDRLELSYARSRMQVESIPFGYFNPKTTGIAPNKSLQRSVEIAWPCRLSNIWNSERIATPPAGNYQVTIRVGIAKTATPPSAKIGESIEAPVLAWQQTIASQQIPITIPDYTMNEEVH